MKLRTEATKGKYKGFLNIMQVRDLKKKASKCTGFCCCLKFDIHCFHVSGKAAS